MKLPLDQLQISEIFLFTLYNLNPQSSDV